MSLPYIYHRQSYIFVRLFYFNLQMLISISHSWKMQSLNQTQPELPELQDRYFSVDRASLYFPHATLTSKVRHTQHAYLQAGSIEY